MYVFNGLDVSTIHVKPETIRWLDRQENDLSCPIYFNKTDEDGYIIWVYSCASEYGVDDGIPEDLENVIIFAFERGIRLIYLDSDACSVEELPQYIDEWEKWDAKYHT